jgi:hypothetical protein
MDETDAVGSERRTAEPFRVRVGVSGVGRPSDRRVVLVVGVRMDVPHPAVGVRVGVEDAASPPDQESHRQRRDQDPDRRLGGAVDALGERLLEEDERQPEQEQGRRVA